MSGSPRIAYAGGRDIGVAVLRFLLEEGVSPFALLVPDRSDADTDELMKLSPDVPPERVLRGAGFRDDAGVAALQSLDLDYIVCVHFPYLVPPAVLAVPRIGALNLHPALLPYNRGWHTPTWAILDGTPFGATLHFMSEEIDEGDIVHQRPLDVRPDDTADTLYARVKALELEVFREAWPALASGSPPRTPQPAGAGTVHGKRDLFTAAVQQIDPDQTGRYGELIDRLRALTTSRLDEAAYVVRDGTRFRIQIKIVPDGSSSAGGFPGDRVEGA